MHTVLRDIEYPVEDFISLAVWIFLLTDLIILFHLDTAGWCQLLIILGRSNMSIVMLYALN
jgi:hypothetical protein